MTTCIAFRQLLRVPKFKLSFILRMMSNRRIELAGPNSLKFSEQPIPIAPPRGLTIKVTHAGICHSDALVWKDKFIISDGKTMPAIKALPGLHYPLVLGHEICGQVHSIGKETCDGDPGVKVGDQVVVYPWRVGCESSCGPCKHDAQSYCSSGAAVESIGINTDGGWQTFVPVKNRSFVCKVPHGLDPAAACLVPCSGITAYHAVLNARPAIERSTKYNGKASILVTGVGGLGLWAVSMARALLPLTTKIYAADVVADKLANAKQAGADDVIFWNSKEPEKNLIEAVTAATDGGVDAALDFVGIATTGSRLQRCVKKGGIVVLVGLAGGILPVPIGTTIMNQISVVGTYVGDKPMVGEVLQLMAEKKVVPPPIQLCNMDTQEVEAAIVSLTNGQAKGRYVIQM